MDPRHLLAQLVRGIGNGEGDQTSALPAQTRIAPADRTLLATLHVLYPAALLPALDLLDRGRVVRWAGPGGRTVYQVIGDATHVVHLRAWHCTCAYFALRAGEEAETETEDDHQFASHPCRHLLACLLAERWPTLRTHVVEEEGDAAALAGVVAGVE